MTRSKKSLESGASSSMSWDSAISLIDYISSLEENLCSSSSKGLEKLRETANSTSTNVSEFSDTMWQSVMTSEELFVKSPEPWIPRVYQKNGVSYLISRISGALFLDPSMGKTSIVLKAFMALLKKGIVKRMLVLAPLKPCHLVWPKEILKWTDFSGLRVEVLHGPKKESALKKDADVYICNFEGLSWLLGAKKTRTPSGKIAPTINLKRIKDLGIDVLCVDELTKTKHTSSQTFKMLKQCLHLFPRRWGLTGSPGANGLLGLFGQIYILDRGITFGQYSTHYRNKYFRPVDPAGWRWVPREGAEEEIYACIAPIAMRLAARDYLDLPPVLNHDVVVTLPQKAMDLYKEVEDELFAMVDEKLFAPVNSGAALNKCRQLAGGAAYIDPAFGSEVVQSRGKKEWVEIHDAKIEAVKELVENFNGSPVMIAYEFAHEKERLLKAFPDAGVLGGGVSTKDALRTESMWNAGKLSELLVHPQSAGHGLNLQSSSCAHVVWFTLTWDQELYEQLIFRICRPGNSAAKIFNHRILARGTADYLVLGTLSAKDKGQQALFDALKAWAKNRRK